jgi:hypothetical protein
VPAARRDDVRIQNGRAMEVTSVKRVYAKPHLIRLGLLRLLTRFSF